MSQTARVGGHFRINTFSIPPSFDAMGGALCCDAGSSVCDVLGIFLPPALPGFGSSGAESALHLALPYTALRTRAPLRPDCNRRRPSTSGHVQRGLRTRSKQNQATPGVLASCRFFWLCPSCSELHFLTRIAHSGLRKCSGCKEHATDSQGALRTGVGL